MKKILLIALLLFVSFEAFSQITRTIWGVSLGNSSKQQVRNMLVNKGYYVESSRDGTLSISDDSIFFGGCVWNCVTFAFVDGKLSDVMFQNNDKNIDVFSTYRNLDKTLSNKYKSFLKQVPLNLNGSDSDSDNWMTISDRDTRVYLATKKQSGINFIILQYEDSMLAITRSISGKNEL